jgi:RimJ/RimL family protein N-acetyltransferase
MITTRFLHTSEYGQYAAWLKQLDFETRQTYFGVPQNDDSIDYLVKGITDNAREHHFLVAEYRGSWIGTIHIAETATDEVEFGVIVDAEHRGRGIADRMLKEAVLWARNRGYHSLYMHCLQWNQPIKHLCTKHGMKLHSEAGETETKMPLPPADLHTLTEEVIIRNRNVYRMFLQRMVPYLDEVYG